MIYLKSVFFLPSKAYIAKTLHPPGKTYGIEQIQIPGLEKYIWMLCYSPMLTLTIAATYLFYTTIFPLSVAQPPHFWLRQSKIQVEETLKKRYAMPFPGRNKIIDSLPGIISNIVRFKDNFASLTQNYYPPKPVNSGKNLLPAGR